MVDFEPGRTISAGVGRGSLARAHEDDFDVRLGPQRIEIVEIGDRGR